MLTNQAGHLKHTAFEGKVNQELLPLKPGRVKSPGFRIKLPDFRIKSPNFQSKLPDFRIKLHDFCPDFPRF